MTSRVWSLGCLFALWVGCAFAQCPTDVANRFISLTGADENDIIGDVRELNVSIGNHAYDRIEVGVVGDAHPKTIAVDTLNDAGGGRKEFKLRVGPRYSAADVVPIGESQRFLNVRTFLRDVCKSEFALSLFGADSRVTAVVIGVNGPGLQYAEDDANEFKRFLERSIPAEDLQVVPLIGKDATQRNIRIAVYAAADHASTQGTVLVYFSGHGVLLDTMGAIGAYFVPYEVQDTEHPTDFVAHKELLEMLGGSKAEHKILIADSCFSGLSLVQNLPKPSDGTWISKSLMDTQRISLINKARNTWQEWFKIPATVLWFSGAQGTEVSYESGKFKGGVFTHYLLQLVTNPITYGMAVDEIVAQMKKDNLDGQHPYLQSNHDFEKMLIPLPKRNLGTN